MTDYPCLRTGRLRLRAFEPSDAPLVQRLAGHAEVAATTLDMPHPYPDGLAEAWIETHRSEWEQGLDLVLAVTTEADGLVGTVSLRIDRRHRHGELGFWIGVPFWNRGYATEAARALVDHAFAELGLQRVFARHFERNPASGRVLEKLGMRREGVLREHLRKGDHFEDVVVSGVLLAEWRGEGSAEAAPTGADEPAWMRIRSSSSVEDMVDANLRVVKRMKGPKKKSWWMLILFLAVLVYVLVQFPGGAGLKLLAAVVTAVIIAAAWLAIDLLSDSFGRRVSERALRRVVVRRWGAGATIPTEFVLDEVGLSTRMADHEYRVRWKGIREIVEQDDDIEIWTRQFGLIIVQNEDFTDPSQRAEWLAFLRAHVPPSSAGPA